MNTTHPNPNQRVSDARPRPPLAGPPAFTLIEMLVVITIIGLVAAMVLNLSGLVGRKKRDTVVVGEKNKLILIIGSYYAKNHFYPPDNGDVASSAGTPGYDGFTATNQLIYELTGATSNPTNNTFLAFDGTSLPTAAINSLFNRGGFANSNPDETQNFFRPTLNPNEYAPYANGMKGLVVPARRNENVGAPNFWHYDSSSTNRHNPNSYDLWAEYAAGRDNSGNPLIITNGNW